MNRSADFSNNEFAEKIADFLRKEIPKRLKLKNRQIGYKGALFILTKINARSLTFHWIGMDAEKFPEYKEIIKKEINWINSSNGYGLRSNNSNIVANVSVRGKILILAGLETSLGRDILLAAAADSELLVKEESPERKNSFEIIAV